MITEARPGDADAHDDPPSGPSRTLHDVVLRLDRAGHIVAIITEGGPSEDGSPAAYAGESIDRFVPAHDVEAVRSGIEAALATGALQHVTYTVSVNEAEVDIRAKLVPAGPDDVLLVPGGAVPRKPYEGRDSEALRFLRQALDALSAHIAILDATGRILDVNHAWRTFASDNAMANPHAGIGENYLEVCSASGDDPVASEVGKGVRDVIEGRRNVFSMEYPCHGPDAQRWFNMVVTRFEMREGVRVVVAHENITGLKLAEQQLVQLNTTLEHRNRELQDFAYVASHDLQEPLRKVQAFADLLVDDYSHVVDETGVSYLERIQNAAHRMSQLISDLLAFSSVASKRETEAVDLNDILEEVRQSLAVALEEANGELHAGDLPTIEADASQMRQLFQNLLSNAIKYRAEERPMRVEVAAEVMRSDALSEGHERDIVRLSVADNGIGFDEKYEDRIFRPFERLHGRGTYSGTGMGLAICRRIAERHGGTIAVTSEPGEGTTFLVTLPVRAFSVDM